VLFVSREAHGDGGSVGPSRRVVNDLVTNTAWEDLFTPIPLEFVTAVRELHEDFKRRWRKPETFPCIATPRCGSCF
jgi:hypothetical protein